MKTVHLNGYTWELVDGVRMPPGDKGGRPLGSRKSIQPVRNIALHEARALVATGVAKIEAARRMKSLFAIDVSAETFARSI